MQQRDLWQIAYSKILLPSMLAGARLSALKNPKTRDTLAGQNGLWERLEQQLARRDVHKPLLWFHVASAGEYLQAMPVMERFMRNGYQCALTVTSITGYNWAQRRRKEYPDLIVADFLPLDTQNNIRRLLELFMPKALVLVKFDLWPNAIWESEKHEVPVFLISATLQMNSKRVTSRLGRSLYQTLYASIKGIYTVSEDDKTRFLQTCPQHPQVINVGDTRFDSVLDRKKQIKPPVLPDFIRNKTVLVIGSCWPADEVHVFPAVREALQRDENFFVIVAPHETDAPHLQAIEQAFEGFSLRRFSSLNSADSTPFRVMLVDTVGQLSALYHYASLAYVGGAFGKGVHNVMEPSAMGAPTMFGPGYQNSPEAMDLLAKGKCFSIRDGDEFRDLLQRLLGDSQLRAQIGEEAQRYINDQAGASDQCFAYIKEAIR